MKCPKCGSATSSVFNTRMQGGRRWRRHQCDKGHRYTTYELHEADVKALGMFSQDDVIKAVAKVLPDFLTAIAANLEVIEQERG